MDTNRTFGIEFEIVSSLTKSELSRKIRTAFANNNINHTLSVEGYGHATDGTNFTNWIAKTDCSIKRVHYGFNHPIEVVSPVLKGKDGLKAVKVVAGILNKYCKVNKSCGLHVHHGVSYIEMMNTAETWIKAEKVVLNSLPLSRRHNTYSRSWTRLVGRSLTPNAIREIKSTRYVSLNLASFTIRKTIEFRCAAGTASPEKAINWILFTQGFINASQTNTSSMELNTIQKIKTFISGQRTTSTSTDSPVFRSAAKNLAHRMISTGRFSAKEIINALRETGYGFNSSKTLIYNSRRSEWTGFGKTTEYVNKKIRFIGSTITSTIEQDADFTAAGSWLKSRYDFFQAA